MPFLASQGTSILRIAGEACPLSTTRIERGNSLEGNRVSCEVGASYYRRSTREQGPRAVFHVKHRISALKDGMGAQAIARFT
jgi:hypothetical protein